MISVLTQNQMARCMTSELTHKKIVHSISELTHKQLARCLIELTHK